METLIVMVVLFALAGYAMNKAHEVRSTPKGEKSPRMERARVKAEARGHQGWLTPFGNAAFSVWSDLWDHQKNKHAVRHGERLGKWHKRRDRRAKRVADRATKREARRTPQGAGDTSGGTPPEAPPATPKSGGTGAATKPATPVAPPAQPSTGGAPTVGTQVNVPPSGEISNPPAAKAKAEEWDKFLEQLLAGAERLKVSFEQQEKALLEGVLAAERMAACLITGGATNDNPAVVAARKARGKLNQMATISGEMVTTYTQIREAGHDVRQQFGDFRDEVDVWLRARQHLNGSMPSLDFLTSGG